MRWQFFLFCLTVEHNIFSWFQFASVSSPRLGCHCHINIIDANCLSSRDIIYLVSSSYYFFMLLFYTLSLLSVQIMDSIAFLLSVCIHILPKQKFVSTKLFFFFFFIAFMTESICLLIYTKREKYMTYLQCCFCLIFT